MDQRNFVHEELWKGCKHVNDFALYKIGIFGGSDMFLDASHFGATPFVPAFEPMTVGLKNESMRPIFRFQVFAFLHFCRGPSGPLSHQSRHNVVMVEGLKRAGWKLPGADKPLNPNEKPARANGWALTTWTERGNFCFYI